MLCTVAEPTSDLPTRALVSKRNAYVLRFCLLELNRDYSGSIFEGEGGSRGELKTCCGLVLAPLVTRLVQRCMHAYIPQTVLALEGVLTCVSFFPSFLPSFLPFFLSFFLSFFFSFFLFFISQAHNWWEEALWARGQRSWASYIYSCIARCTRHERKTNLLMRVLQIRFGSRLFAPVLLRFKLLTFFFALYSLNILRLFCTIFVKYFDTFLHYIR